MGFDTMWIACYVNDMLKNIGFLGFKINKEIKDNEAEKMTGFDTDYRAGV